MKVLLAGGATLITVAAITVWLFFSIGQGADLGKTASPVTGQVETNTGLVVHEWGTFTSFSGADGVPVGFRPNNTDLPNFIYFQECENFKSRRLERDGTISMETPVIYFYTDKAMRASVRVDFPRGWITENKGSGAPNRSCSPDPSTRTDQIFS